MIYWSSTKAPVHLFTREYECAANAKHVSENAFIDPSLLAAELRINTDSVKAYQRRLGVRAIVSDKRRRS